MTSLLVNILTMIVGEENFHFKIQANGDTDEYLDNTSSASELNSETFIAGLVSYNLEDINKVWFLIDNEYLKVFDRNQVNDMQSFLVDTKEQMLQALNTMKESTTDVETPLATNNKICG